jgi:hypothetical protein
VLAGEHQRVHVVLVDRDTRVREPAEDERQQVDARHRRQRPQLLGAGTAARLGDRRVPDVAARVAVAVGRAQRAGGARRQRQHEPAQPGDDQ